MINSENYEHILNAQMSDAKMALLRRFDDNLLSFNQIQNFPSCKGIYFLFESLEKTEYGNDPIYIGSAYAGNRTIKIRCSQYLQKGSGGESLRKKIELLKKVNPEEAIAFTKTNIFARFILLPNSDKDTIRQLEQVAIWSFCPPINFILCDFSYEQLKLK